MTFDKEFFHCREFSEDQIDQYFSSAKRDLDIANNGKESEVIFTFTYHSFLKLGIVLIAFKGYKVKSRQGHHVQIIRQFSKILNDNKIEIYGEAMRRKRNIDLYAGGTLVTEKEAKEYLKSKGVPVN